MSEYQVGDKVECEWLFLLFNRNSCPSFHSDYAIGGGGGGNENSSTTGVIEDGTLTFHNPSPSNQTNLLTRDPFIPSSD